MRYELSESLEELIVCTLKDEFSLMRSFQTAAAAGFYLTISVYPVFILTPWRRKILPVINKLECFIAVHPAFPRHLVTAHLMCVNRRPRQLLNRQTDTWCDKCVRYHQLMFGFISDHWPSVNSPVAQSHLPTYVCLLDLCTRLPNCCVSAFEIELPTPQNVRLLINTASV